MAMTHGRNRAEAMGWTNSIPGSPGVGQVASNGLFAHSSIRHRDAVLAKQMIPKLGLEGLGNRIPLLCHWPTVIGELK